MSIETLLASRCPYCQHPHGDIFIDVRELDVMRAERVDCSDEEAHRRFVRHNSRQPESGPCPHLVQLLIDIRYFSEATGERPSDSWETCAAWLNPRVRELDPCDELMELHNDLLVIGDSHEFALNSPYDSDSFFHAWSVFSQNGKAETSWEAEGYAMFAADIGAFYAELKLKNDLRQAAGAAGR